MKKNKFKKEIHQKIVKSSKIFPIKISDYDQVVQKIYIFEVNGCLLGVPYKKLSKNSLFLG